MSSVCKYFQSGYCKFGNNCRSIHNTEICQSGHCDRNFCERRHPKSCHYFQRNGYCKFGEFCQYSHNDDKDKGKLIEIENKIDNIMENDKQKDEEIVVMKNTLELLKQ